MYVLAGLMVISCKESSGKKAQADVKVALKTASPVKEDSIVYKTGNLIIRRLSDHVYEHISFLSTHDFGKVDCNGMIIINENEAVIFDTPADDESSEELINYVNKLKCTIKAVIPTHFHEDCVGGLATFNKHSIPAYASNQTIELLKKKKNKSSNLLKGFDDSLTLNVGNEKVYAEYFGEGHTKDNIIGYFPEDRVVFGGCLIKEVGAKKGNLEDANVIAWPKTVGRLRQQYPQAQIVIPGHGKFGGTELFDYTIKLFE